MTSYSNIGDLHCYGAHLSVSSYDGLRSSVCYRIIKCTVIEVYITCGRNCMFHFIFTMAKWILYLQNRFVLEIDLQVQTVHASREVCPSEKMQPLPNLFILLITFRMGQMFYLVFIYVHFIASLTFLTNYGHKLHFHQ